MCDTEARERERERERECVCTLCSPSVRQVILGYVVSSMTPSRSILVGRYPFQKPAVRCTFKHCYTIVICRNAQLHSQEPVDHTLGQLSIFPYPEPGKFSRNLNQLNSVRILKQPNSVHILNQLNSVHIPNQLN